jgi:hypothetical protein
MALAVLQHPRQVVGQPCEKGTSVPLDGAEQHTPVVLACLYTLRRQGVYLAAIGSVLDMALKQEALSRNHHL